MEPKVVNRVSGMINLVDNSSRRIKVSSENENIRLIANQSIEQLLLNNPNLLVYPQSLGNCQDDLGKQSIFSICEDVDNAQQRYFNIRTGNIVGFIGTGTASIAIRSRFCDPSGVGDDYFLHYMLQKVLSINLFDMNHSFTTEDQAFDFLLLLFPTLLKNALLQGVYKEYRSHRRNDAHVRGVINVSRHIAENIPFNGKVAYNSREVSYDNNVIQLIRHTIEYISTTDFGRAILASDSDTREAVNKIKYVTPSFVKSNRNAVIRANSKIVRHPYFTQYSDLQVLCKRILRHEKLKYGENTDTIHGIMFDASWLWEEYLATLLPSYEHPNNRKRAGAIYMASNNQLQRFPDFYKGDNGGIVLDAKYKHAIDRDDEHQVIAYMYRLKSRHGGFIMPREAQRPKVCYSLLGYGNELSLNYLEIPSGVSDAKDFVHKMHLSEMAFKQAIDTEL